MFTREVKGTDLQVHQSKWKRKLIKAVYNDASKKLLFFFFVIVLPLQKKNKYKTD